MIERHRVLRHAANFSFYLEHQDQLKKLSETPASEEASRLPTECAKGVRRTIAEAYEKLRKVIEDLDPVEHPGFVFEPSNPNVAGRIVGIAIIAQERKPLTAVERFYESGMPR